MKKVAIIDDDKNLQSMASIFMTSSGWTVVCASDGAAGLELVAREKPDVIVLDVNLPDISGFEVCSRLKSDPATKAVPVLLFSGRHKAAEDILNGLEVRGADSYLVKPVHLSVLTAKLEAMLRAAGSHGLGAVDED
ncbi:MAG: response regulator [Elusimicrobiota bacterium]